MSPLRWFEIALLAGVLGGLLQLDRKELGQVLLSPPLICAPLLGWLLGQPRAGLEIGAAFGLLWAADLGRAIRHAGNDTLAAVIAVSGVAVLEGGPATTGLVLLLSAPVVALGPLLDGRRERANVSLSREALARVADGDGRALGRAVGRGLLRAAWPAALIAALGTLIVATLASMLQPLLPARVLVGLAWLPSLLPALGAGVALTAMPGRGPVVAFGLVALVVGSGLGWLGGDL